MQEGLTTFTDWISANSYKLVLKVVSDTTFNINDVAPWYTSWVWLGASGNGTATLVNPISNGVVLEIKNCDANGNTLTLNTSSAIIYVGGGIGIVSSVTLDPGGTIYMIPDGTYLQVIDWFQPM
ncbi:MAG: hypothetical protein ABSD77_07820 [Verrucomicrobiota bacterium]|jgi:hypothetical protein